MELSESPLEHEYSEPNHEYLATWFDREDDGPMWALNLMKYREKAVYDGVESDISGLEADNEYSPIEPLAAVGARMVLVTPVEAQLRGDDTVWDRIAIVLYPTRVSMAEMAMREDFRKTHEHKNAGMERTIVVASFPYEGDPAPTGVGSAAGTDDKLLMQLVTDADAPDTLEGIDHARIARFWVEGNIFGDDRQWAEARFSRISAAVADQLTSAGSVGDSESYVTVMTPQWDDLAESVVKPLP